jgi:hypothetical protein
LERVVGDLVNLSPTIINKLIQTAEQKCFKAKVIPGEAVGAVAA